MMWVLRCGTCKTNIASKTIKWTSQLITEIWCHTRVALGTPLRLLPTNTTMDPTSSKWKRYLIHMDKHLLLQSTFLKQEIIRSYQDRKLPKALSVTHSRTSHITKATMLFLKMKEVKAGFTENTIKSWKINRELRVDHQTQCMRTSIVSIWISQFLWGMRKICL